MESFVKNLILLLLIYNIPLRTIEVSSDRNKQTKKYTLLCYETVPTRMKLPVNLSFYLQIWYKNRNSHISEKLKQGDMVI